MGRWDTERESNREKIKYEIKHVKEKLFYITPQPLAKHIIIEFASLQCNILKTVCTRPAKNVTRMFYSAAPSPHVFVM